MAAEDPNNPIRLENYQISRNTGFLIDQPLLDLPPEFAAWHDLASTAADELAASRSIRQRVDQMPILDYRTLKSYRQKRLAHLQLTAIATCYIWQDGKEGVPEALPARLSIPWWGLSQDLGLQPAVSYAAIVEANWKVLDKTKPRSLENLEVLYPWPGGESAKWFVLVTAQMEMDFVPGLKHIETGLSSLFNEEEESLITSLLGLQQVMETLQSTFRKMRQPGSPGRVVPAEFYNDMRPFLSGWGDEGSALPYGLIFTAVSDQPKKVKGGSGAQSSIYQTIDAFLGVEHTLEERAFLMETRSYMPPDHRKFIEKIETGPSLRQYVMKCKNEDLKTAFDKCVKKLIAFRNFHLAIVKEYIVDQAGEEVKGTGGSSPTPLLTAIRIDTENAKIKK